MIRPLLLSALLVAAACSGGGGDASAGPLVLVTHDSFALSDGLLETFTEDTGVEVQILAGGDAGEVLNQAVLTADDPLGDVLFGVDNTFLDRALDADLFVPYASPALDAVPDEFELDAEHRVTPIDYGDVCVNFDKAFLADRDIAVPERLEDLVRPEYRGLLVVENPATSSPGLAFLMATVAHFGADGEYPWRSYWADLVANDVRIAMGWEEAYNIAFSGSAGRGDRPLVVSYASSPPIEVLFADPQPSEAPTGVMTQSCFRQVETVGILRGTEREAAARQLVDFMLSERFQEDMPLNMFVFPVRDGATVPEAFLRHTTLPVEPRSLPAEAIRAGRDRWIDEWTDTVLG